MELGSAWMGTSVSVGRDVGRGGRGSLEERARHLSWITFHACYFSQPKPRAMAIRLREVSSWPKTSPPLCSVVGELHSSLFSLLREGLPSLCSSITSVMSLVMALTGAGLKAAGNRDEHLQDL